MLDIDNAPALSAVRFFHSSPSDAYRIPLRPIAFLVWLLATLVSLVAFQAKAESAQSGAGAGSGNGAIQEIRFLKARLKQLEEKVDTQARKQKETQVQIQYLPAENCLARDALGNDAC